MMKKKWYETKKKKLMINKWISYPSISKCSLFGTSVAHFDVNRQHFFHSLLTLDVLALSLSLARSWSARKLCAYNTNERCHEFACAHHFPHYQRWMDTFVCIHGVYCFCCQNRKIKIKKKHNAIKTTDRHTDSKSFVHGAITFCQMHMENLVLFETIVQPLGTTIKMTQHKKRHTTIFI